MMGEKNDSRKKLIKGCARATIVTLFAFALSAFLLEPLSFSAFSLFSVPEKSDFTITDLYAQVANRRPVRTIDQDIILVDVGYSKREEIIDIINQVKFWQPKVVGVDILFEMTTPHDSLLLAALYESDNVIVPVGLEEIPDGSFAIREIPFFYPDKRLTYAASNLPSKFEGGTIREFVTSFPLEGGDTILSFPQAVAIAYDSRALTTFRQRNNRYEMIDYPSRDFVILTHNEIAEAGDLLTDRIVLIGAVSDALDIHGTPIDRYMPGLLIHASSVSTILNDRFFDPAFKFPSWLPAFFFCFLMLLARELITEPKLKGLITRLMQITIVYCAVRIGYHYYLDKNKIFDFSYTLIMMTFGLMASDLWLGITYFAERSTRFVSKLTTKKPDNKNETPQP